MELLLVIFMLIIAYFMFELFDGVVSVFKFCASDDKWIAASAAISLIGAIVAYILLS